MKRRDLMKVAPVAFIAGAVPAVAGLPAMAVAPACAEAETPILALYRQWSLINDGLSDEIWDVRGDEAFSVEVARANAIAQEMLLLPAQSATEFVAKAAAWSCFGDFGLDDMPDPKAFWAEARALVGGAA